MEIRPIRTKANYKATLKEIDLLATGESHLKSRHALLLRDQALTLLGQVSQ
jgi:hypothetical protein